MPAANPADQIYLQAANTQPQDNSSYIPKDIKEYKEKVGEKLKGIEDTQKESEDIYEKEKSLLKMPPTPAAPKPEDFQTPLAQKFTSSGMLVATLGSLFTRHALTSAANSTASVLNAYNTGDQVRYKEAYDKWKTDTENSQKMMEWEKDMLKSMSEMVDKKEKNYESQIDLIGKAMGNPLISDAVKSGQLKLYLSETQNNIDKHNEHTEAMKAIEARKQAGLDAWQEANPGKKIPSAVLQDINDKAQSAQKQIEQGKYGSTGSELTDEQYEKLKTDPAMQLALRAYEVTGDARQALGGGTMGGKTLQPRIEALQRMEAEKNPDFNPGVVKMMAQGYQKELNAVQTQNAKISLASNILDSSIPSLIDSANKLGLSESTSINDLYNAARQQFNSADFKNFQTQLRAATTDYAQFLGRGRQTVHSDEEALKILNENMDTSSLGGFRDAVRTERTNVAKGVEDTLQEIQDKMSGKITKSEEPKATHKWNIDTGQLEEIK